MACSTCSGRKTGKKNPSWDKKTGLVYGSNEVKKGFEKIGTTKKVVKKKK